MTPLKFAVLTQILVNFIQACTSLISGVHGVHAWKKNNYYPSQYGKYSLGI